MNEADLAFAGVARQVDLLAAREVSAGELVELYLSRIEELDGRIGAFTKVLPDSRAEAARPAGARGGAAVAAARGPDRQRRRRR